MDAGHFTGFGRSLLEEDVVIQTSMGPILDRTKENLSSSDVAVAHLRRMLLDAVAASDAGTLPPGSALAPPTASDSPTPPRCWSMRASAGRTPRSISSPPEVVDAGRVASRPPSRTGTRSTRSS